MFPALDAGERTVAITVDGQALSYRELSATAAGLAGEFGSARRVAVWATPELGTCLAVVAAITAGVPAVPINPTAGSAELAHIVADSAPDVVAATPGTVLPAALAGVRRVDARPLPGRAVAAATHDPEAPALIVYTSGTTGPPKGVVLPRRAITSNLDALATAWEWTARDVLVHGLPLFHVHGLVLGLLGPLRLGATVQHLGRFSTQGVAAALSGAATTPSGPATMLFGVPTMYRRLADAAQQDPAVASALARARLLVSGSAALPTTEHERISRLTGQRVVERYGMTETLMNCGVRAGGERRPGSVGPALDGVEVRLVDETGAVIDDADDETVAEIQVRGPNLFLEYLNRPEATAQAMREGWFVTGDVATRGTGGYLRIVGRKATDLIKSGGFKIGAGEIENVLLAHPAVAEVAVTGEPDDDLGERVVAWVVPRPGALPTERELAEHVAAQLAPYKRPRTVRFLDVLPRNDLGKIMKARLCPPGP